MHHTRVNQRRQADAVGGRRPAHHRQHDLVAAYLGHREVFAAVDRHAVDRRETPADGRSIQNIEGIADLDGDLVRDPRNFVSVHFYYPFLFTHQGATWSEPYLAGIIGVPYPAAAGSRDQTLEMTRARFRSLAPVPGANSAAVQAEAEIAKYFDQAQGPAQIEDWMNKVADWQKRQGVDSSQIVFTEFGAMKQTIGGVELDRASRARWLRDTSATIEGHGWGWTAYVLRDDPFGLYVRESDRYPDPNLMRALRLGVPKAAESDRHAGP